MSSGRAGHTNRTGPTHAVGELLEQVEQRRVGPVDVLDDGDHRSARGRAPRRTIATRRASSAVPRAARAVAERERPDPRCPRCRPAPRSPSPGSLRPRCVIRSRTECRGSVRGPPPAGRCRARRASSFRISASGQYVTPSPYGRQRPRTTDRAGSCASAQATNSRDEAALADARVAVDRHEVRAALGGRALVKAPQQLELGVAADHRRAQARERRAPAASAPRFQEQDRRDRPLLASELAVAELAEPEPASRRGRFVRRRRSVRVRRPARAGRPRSRRHRSPSAHPAAGSSPPGPRRC